MFIFSVQGFPVYLCSLDAEGAFDSLPFAVLFSKIIGIVPDACWRVMLNWYRSMRVRIKWNFNLGSEITVERGTHQGGLTSPFLFNVFYQDLITELNSECCEITIKGCNYNVYCYADDILLASSTPTGLQRLVDISVNYITKHGLRFNPVKTECFTYGKSTFLAPPSCTMEGVVLKQEDALTYLGAVLKGDGGSAHTDRRVLSAQKAFYSLQGAGLCHKGVDPSVASHLYSVGVRTVLLYGCEALHLSRRCLKKLETCQGKLIKSFLALRKSSDNSPVLQALGIPTVSASIGHSSLNLLRSSILFNSNATRFYCHLLSHPNLCSSLLVSRCHKFLQNCEIDFTSFVFNHDYYMSVKSAAAEEADGLSDSIKMLLTDYNDSARDIVQMLVSSF